MNRNMNNPHRIIPSIRRAARAFTLVEMIVVIIIIGVLLAMIGPRVLQRVGQSKQVAAQNNALAISSALKQYMLDNGVFPDPNNLGVLAAKPTSPDSKGPWLDNADALKDPWGRPYILVIPAQKNADFDVVSYGADGKPGGTGEDADVIKP